MAEQPPIPQATTALILNDMINGNLRTKSNAEHNKLIEESGIIKNSIRLVGGMRERKIPIIWIRVERRGRLRGCRLHADRCVPGEWPQAASRHGPRFVRGGQRRRAALGNPLYHWTHMELRRSFGIETLLSPATARAAFDRANERLAESGFTAMGLLKQFLVAVVCTTDDPVDTLEPHARLAARKDPDTLVFPTWRPDKAVLVEDLPAWTAWLSKLEKAAGASISTWDSLLAALEKRHSFFHERGCRASDHGLEAIDALPATDDEAKGLFSAAAGREGPRPGRGPPDAPLPPQLVAAEAG